MVTRALLVLIICASCVATTSTLSGEIRESVDLQERIYSLDWFMYQNWEEMSIAKPTYFRYTGVRPYLFWYGSSVSEGAACRDLFDMLYARGLWHVSRQHYLLDRVFKPSGANSHFSKRNVILAYRLVPFSEERYRDDEKPLHSVGAKVETWYGWRDRWQVHIRARLENHGELNPQFHGRVWEDKLTGWVDNAAVYYYRNGFFASFGRSFIQWGPDSRDALLLSDYGPPLDRLWLGYENDVFRFDVIHSRLDDMRVGADTLNRYLSAHRLTFRKAGLFELGLSEVALYGGPGRQLEWYYLNPFLPYYWEQWNQRTEDNIMFGADFVLYWPKRARIFGELLIDDFQIDFESEPHQVGYKLGIDALEPFGLPRLFTKLTYTRINPTVYGQIMARNLYLHRGEPIGYYGGNDQDRWLGLLRYHANVNFDFELELQRQRRGEGKIGVFEVAAVPYQDHFPTGIVEKSTMLTLRCDFFSRLMLQGYVAASYEHLENFEHVEGVDHDRFGLDISLSWYLEGSTNN